jgi:hypothetical protein
MSVVADFIRHAKLSNVGNEGMADAIRRHGPKTSF